MVAREHPWLAPGPIVLALVLASPAGCQGPPFSASDPDGAAPSGPPDASAPADASAPDTSAPDAADARARDGAQNDVLDSSSRSDASADAPPRDARIDVADSASSPIEGALHDAVRADVTEGGSSPMDANARDTTVNDAGPSYRTVVLTDAPLAYWRMGIRTGTMVPDESGHQNDLTLQGGGHALGVAGAISGDLDTAIRFDGVGSFATAARPRDFDFPSRAPFTIECWARREPLADGGEGAFFQHLLGSAATNGPTNRNGFLLYVLPTPGAGSLYTGFEYDVPDGDQNGMQGPLPAVSTYGYYAAVFDGMSASLYVDGILAGSVGVRGSMSVRNSDLAVGFEWSTGRYNFSGAIDEVAIYDKALTALQIERHHDVGIRR